MDLLGAHLDEDVLPRELAASRDREVFHEDGRAEEEGVVVLGSDPPGDAVLRHGGRLGLPFGGGLDPRDAEEVEKAVALLDHLGREAGGLHRLRAGPREVPDLDRLPPFPFRLSLDLSAGFDGPRLPSRRDAIEHEYRLDSCTDEVARAVDHPAQMRGHPTLSVV